MENLSFEHFCEAFPTEDICCDTFNKVRWPNGFTCPHCGCTDAYVIRSRRLPLYACKSCKTQTSLISGTVMEGSRTPLRLWFHAIYLHARPYGVNALQLSQFIQVTYKTAWLICHKLRHAMSRTDSQTLLQGLVNVTDAILSPRFPNASGEWQRGEQPLLAGSSKSMDDDLLHLKIKHWDKQSYPNTRTRPDMRVFINRYVDPQVAAIVTYRMDFSKQNRATGKPLRDLCEEASYWLSYTFGGIGRKHLQVYLDHFCYTFHYRHMSLFQKLLQDCILQTTIIYPVLTGKIPAPHRRIRARRSRLSSAV